MKALEIDVNKLLEVCRMHGTGNEGYKAVAKKFGITEKQAENQIYLKKIRRMLTAENTSKKPLIPETAPDIAISGGEQEDPKVSLILNESIKKETVLSVEDELFDKIKSIIKENKQMKAITAENEALRNMISSIHGKLQEIIADIKKGGQIE